MKGDKLAYQFFSEKGKKTDYGDLLKDAQKADIILFGELHNNSICHWLQFELTKDLYEKLGSKLILGAEMFESDGQLLITEYLSGKISARSFESQSRLWPNYKTDYKPIMDYAAKNIISFVATNIPRRYASIVNEKGFEGLNGLLPEAKKYIAPLPIKYDPELPGYKGMLQMGGMGNKPNLNLPKAQAVKDATMAYFILQNWEPGKKFLHFNGTYHSNNFEGIVWYLKLVKPELKILTIASVEQDTIHKLNTDSEKLANYILCIPSSVTKTH